MGEPNGTVRCGKCGQEIGRYVQEGKEIWLEVAGLRLYAAHGKCVCGARYDWASTDKALEKLLARCKG